MKISVILPCRNEELALPSCLRQIREVVEDNNLDAEIIVSDSSSDKSPEIALRAGAILVKHDKEGYGNAYLEAFKVAKGDFIFMADCDGSYDFREIPKFIRCLEMGYDFVMGDRFGGRIEEGAMPALHKHVGNPLLSGLFRLFFKSNIKDVHCGMRAISRKALDKLDLQTVGMEFASEMVIKAIRHNFRIAQVRINYFKRKGNSKLKSFSDGWRHLRFMLLYSPIFLFLIPGIIILFLGLESMIWMYFGNAELFGIKLYFHPMFLSSLFMILGYQLIIFSAFAKIYSITHLNEKSDVFDRLFKLVTIEKAGISGSITVVLGILVYAWIFAKWAGSGFGSLDEIKNSIVALTFIIIGFQTIFSSFMLSILGIKEKR